jgi:hypothetical protein
MHFLLVFGVTEAAAAVASTEEVGLDTSCSAIDATALLWLLSELNVSSLTTISGLVCLKTPLLRSHVNSCSRAIKRTMEQHRVIQKNVSQNNILLEPGQYIAFCQLSLRDKIAFVSSKGKAVFAD